MLPDPDLYFDSIASLTDPELALAASYTARPRPVTDATGHPLLDPKAQPLALPTGHVAWLLPRPFLEYAELYTAFTELKRRLLRYLCDRTSTPTPLATFSPAHYQLLVVTLGGFVRSAPRLPQLTTAYQCAIVDFLARQYQDLTALLLLVAQAPCNLELATALAANWPSTPSDLVAVTRATQLTPA